MRNSVVAVIILALILAFSMVAVVGAAETRGETATFSSQGDAVNATESGADANSSAQNQTVSVIIRFSNVPARNAATFENAEITITGGSDIRYTPVLFADVPSEMTATLESRPDVRSVIRDETVSIGPGPVADLSSSDKTVLPSATQEVPWGVDRLNARTASASLSVAQKDDVIVAVIDTGIDYTHPELDDTVTWGVNFSSGASTTGLSSADDDNGHGTAAAGIVAAEDDGTGVVGVAPGIDLYAIKVLDSGGYGTFSQIVAGIDASLKGEDGTLGTADDADVLSLSLGSESGSNSLRAMVDDASDHAVVVSAAGNGGDGSIDTNEITYPAKYDSSIAVAATNRYDKTATFSAEGEEVELAAPGVTVSTTFPGGTIGDFSGTSAAAPHVAGTAALVIANDLADGERDLTASDVRSRLRETTVDIETDGVDRTSGYGLVQADAAVGTQQPAAFSVDSVPSSIPVTDGDTFDVSAQVSNTGDETGTKSVTLRIDGDTVAQQDVTLSPGETRTVTFDGLGTDDLAPGTYSYRVASDGSSASGSLVIEAPPAFDITGVSPPAPNVTQGETMTLQVSIENTGGDGTRSIDIRLDGDTISTKTATLTGGENSTIAFTVETGSLSPGSYDLRVVTGTTTWTGTLTVEADEATEPSVTRTLSATDIAPGDTVVVSVNTSVSSGTFSLSESFTPTAEGATLESVSVDGQPVDPLVGVADQDGVVVTLNDLEQGATVLVRYVVTFPTDATPGETYTISGDATDSSTTPLSVSELTVVEGALGGVAGGYDADADGTISIGELGAASADYANGALSITDLGVVAGAYANA